MLSEKLFRQIPAAQAVAAVALALAAPLAADTVRGRLEPPEADRPLRLATAEGESVELVTDEGLDLTMRDPQLAARTWEVRGSRLDDGRLAVEKIFTIKGGELHRVTYYCEICHITTHEPGRCMCCQADTDLREVPGE